MANKQSLVPVEQKEVAFYDDEVVAVRIENGNVYVPVRPICDLLGVNFDGQRRRINRDAVLSEEVMSVVVTTTDLDPSSRQPGRDGLPNGNCPTNYGQTAVVVGVAGGSA